MGQVQKDEQVAIGIGEAVDPADVWNNKQDASLCAQALFAVNQKLEWVVQMLEHVMQVDQVSPGAAQSLSQIIDGAVLRMLDPVAPRLLDQASAVVAAGNLKARFAKTLQRAARAAAHFKHPAIRGKKPARQR